jgi:RHS repeat-associated protein
MNTRKLLFATFIALAAASYLLAETLVAQFAVAGPLQLALNHVESAEARSPNGRGVAGLVSLRPNQLKPVALHFLVDTAGDADAPEDIRFIGADPPASGISTEAVDPSGTMISLTEGNLIESQNISEINCSTCPTCPASRASSNNTHGVTFNVTYNSRDANGSRTRLDTVMGYGWTHSFNIFLFSQLGSMFRVDGDGRITKYKLNSNGTFTSDTGYFDTLVRKTHDTFVLTQKDKTRFTFAPISGTPFSVGGPVLRLTQIRDRNNDTVTLTYSSGNLASVRDTYGRTLTFTYNAQGKVASVGDPLGRTTTFTYDSTGRSLTTIIDPTGNVIRYTYNTLYEVTTKLDKDGRAFGYTYSNGKPTASRDNTGALNFSLSNPNNWAIDATALATNQLLVYQPSITTKTDGRGNLWRCEYDSQAYATKMTAPDGAITRCTYDPVTRLVASITDADNHTTQHEYDLLGNHTKTTLAAPFNYVTTSTYEPAFNMMTSTTDPKGRLTTFNYDSRGNRTRATDPLLQTRQWTYDTHGNILAETDKRGHSTIYTYDAGGNRNMMTGPPPLGYITRMTYDNVGNLKTRIDPDNHTTMFDYDGLNRLITETDPSGHSARSFYNGEGNLIQTTDRNDHITFFQYDQRKRLFRTTDSLGQTILMDYDNSNNRIFIRDKNGHPTTFEFDLQNRLTRTTDAEGNVSTMLYDPAGNLTSNTDANLHTTTSTYDALNRRSTTTDAIGNVTINEFDMGGSGCGTCGATPGSSLITKQTDGNGKVTYYKYDQLDRLTTIVRKEGDTADVIDPSDAVTRYSYDPDNNRLSMTEPNGNITAYEYDALSRPTKEMNAAGDVSRLTYDGVNNVITTTAPNGNVATNTYDALDRVIQVDDSIGRVLSSTYDNVGNRLSQTDGNGNTTRYNFDAIDRPTIVTDPLTRTTVTQYDAVGNVLRVTDREGRMTTNIYDDINRRTSSTDALSHTTQYQYDGVGNVVMLTDANGHSTQYLHDNINRVIRETYADPAPNTRTFVYDAVNLTSRTDQRNQTTVYTYNDLYFLMKRAYPVSPSDNFTYDLSARLLVAERGGWLVTFAYDGANRVTQTMQNGKTVNYVHNIPGRTRVVTFPGGRSIEDQMDSRNRLTITALPTASPIPIVQYRYDLGNRVLTRSYGNNVAANYTYNANDWIKSLDHILGGGAGGRGIASFGYDFDNEGNKTVEQKRHDAGRSETYQYDPIYRLIDYKVGPLSAPSPTAVTQTTYNLDPVGNWNSKTTDGVIQTRLHNEANELTRIDAINLTYDNNGNLQNDGAYSYAYDEENRLLRVTRNSDSAIVGQYQYDALSRRVQKIANPAGVPSTIRYFYDDARIIEEQTAGSATQATYVYGNYIDEVLTIDRGGQTYYYHQNSLWSVEAITNSAGAVVERYSFDAYGRPSVFTGSGTSIPPNPWGTPHSTIGNPWMFTGRQLDEESGLYFYRARYFDSNKGRFIMRDPIGVWSDPISLGNSYAYVGNNPINRLDPRGLVVYTGVDGSKGHTCDTCTCGTNGAGSCIVVAADGSTLAPCNECTETATGVVYTTGGVNRAEALPSDVLSMLTTSGLGAGDTNTSDSKKPLGLFFWWWHLSLPLDDYIWDSYDGSKRILAITATGGADDTNSRRGLSNDAIASFSGAIAPLAHAAAAPSSAGNLRFSQGSRQASVLVGGPNKNSFLCKLYPYLCGLPDPIDCGFHPWHPGCGGGKGLSPFANVSRSSLSYLDPCGPWGTLSSCRMKLRNPGGTW